MLNAAFECTPDVDSPQRTPVLLVHGLGATVEENWGSNYTKFLPQEGYPTCTVQIPDRGLDDIQRNVEYVVYAIRRIAQRSGSKISFLGYSEGALLATYGLRYWPDLARKIDDVVGFAGVYTYGTDIGNEICAGGICPPALHQLKPGSSFMRGVARAPLPAGPSYTGYLTLTDELVRPQPTASTIEGPGARTYIEQEICPLDLAEHTTIINEAPFLALTLDALTHRGPASRERVGEIPCGYIPEAAVGSLPNFATFFAAIATEGPAISTTEAPALRCYLDPACAKPRLAPTLRARTTPKRDRRPPLRFLTRGTLGLPPGATEQCGGTVVVRVKRAGHTIARGKAPVRRRNAPLGADCRFRLRLTLARTVNEARRLQGRLRFRVRFTGTDELLPAPARTRSVRAK